MFNKLSEDLKLLALAKMLEASVEILMKGENKFTRKDLRMYMSGFGAGLLALDIKPNALEKVNSLFFISFDFSKLSKDE